jgi:hypothetical protein
LAVEATRGLREGGHILGEQLSALGEHGEASGLGDLDDRAETAGERALIVAR